MLFQTKLIFAVASLSGFAAASTAPTSVPCLSDPVPSDPPCYDGIICVDYFSCGKRYGGCYNPCHDPEPEQPPPCSPTTTAPEPTPTDEEEDNCSTRIICIDAINDCGIPYGGCIPDCTPLDLTTPPCPTSTLATVTQKVTGTATAW